MNTLIIILASVSQLCFAEPVAEMASRIVELRAEVEKLGQEVEQERKQNQNQLEQVLQRKSELEMLFQKESLRQQQLSEKAKILRSLVGVTAKSSNEDYAALRAWHDELLEIVQSSMPFLFEKRKAELEVIGNKISKRVESPITLANQLWSATEKELNLTQTNEYLITSLPGQENTKAEIARFGLVQMLWRNSKGDVGYMEQTHGNWQTITAHANGQKAAIQRAIDKFRNKQISGWFELPGLNVAEVQ